MSQSIPPPNYHNLLPPLLACLPTALASPRPPPALLPLLSPILRQRLQLLAATALSPKESWLPLLCWELGLAERLSSVVGGDAFEIHPVSGEIDIGDVQAIQYKRFDKETLRAKILLPDLGLSVTYLWCPEDQEGDESGWRVSEVSPIEGQESNSAGWSSSITEAIEVVEKIRTNSLRNGASSSLSPRSVQGKSGNARGTINDEDADEDDEESYWAQYSTTPGRSPGGKHSPLDINSLEGKNHQGTISDAEYYARYAHVQPVMEKDDPSENHNGLSKSILEEDILHLPVEQNAGSNQGCQSVRPSKSGVAGMDCEVGCRRFSSPSSRSTALSRLEDSAVAQSASEVAIRQHVSTSIKSLFRLTRGAGLDREEFNDIVRRELDTLSLIAEDD